MSSDEDSLSSISSEESEDETSEDENGNFARTSDCSDIDMTDAILEDTGEDEENQLESNVKEKDGDDDNVQRVHTKANLMWNGERLFPPARKSAKASKAWEFGGFVKYKTGRSAKNRAIHLR